MDFHTLDGINIHLSHREGVLVDVVVESHTLYGINIHLSYREGVLVDVLMDFHTLYGINIHQSPCGIIIVIVTIQIAM